MEHAIYAIGLLQIGSVCRKGEVEWQGMRYYGTTLKALRCELEAPEKDAAAVVSSSAMVLLCQVYRSVAENVVSWPTQVSSIVRLVKGNRRELFSSPIGRIMYEKSCMLEVRYIEGEV